MLDIFYFSTKNILKTLAIEMIQELEIIEKLSKIYLKNNNQKERNGMEIR